jgi:hypothetical protein
LAGQAKILIKSSSLAKVIKLSELRNPNIRRRRASFETVPVEIQAFAGFVGAGNGRWVLID